MVPVRAVAVVAEMCVCVPVVSSMRPVPTCLMAGRGLSGLGERVRGWGLLSSDVQREVQREVSGESRWRRSLERPRSFSRSPCFHGSVRDTAGRQERRGTQERRRPRGDNSKQRH